MRFEQVSPNMVHSRFTLSKGHFSSPNATKSDHQRVCTQELFDAVGCVLGDPYLDGVWPASVDGHAHSEATEDCRSSAVTRRLLSALRVVQELCRPGQQQQAVLHIQGPCYGVYWVVESHGEGITLCCNLQHTQDWFYTAVSVRRDHAQ